MKKIIKFAILSLMYLGILAFNHPDLEKNKTLEQKTELETIQTSNLLH